MKTSCELLLLDGYGVESDSDGEDVEAGKVDADASLRGLVLWKRASPGAFLM
jgi:hypothetical protein